MKQKYLLGFFLLILAVTQSENERSCILLVRQQRRDGSYIWCHLVMQVRELEKRRRGSILPILS